MAAKIRYAVVGQGHIAQVAVLPAFDHATKNSELTALVSGDPVKRKKLGKKYGVEHLYDYDQYDDALKSGNFDAVYIALPNDMHRDFAERAARAGIHVLSEKPLAPTESDCMAMIAAAKAGKVKLMTAYRLHFEEANMKAVEIAKSGKLGELRLFNSVFSMQVKEENIRLKRERGGGPLFDIGIYCINAARYIFREEPLDVYGTLAKGDDPRFAEVEEAASVIMRFPDEKLATFTCSFGAADTGFYRVVGTKGDLTVCPAFEYAEGLTHHLVINGKMTEKTFPKRDQFAPELIYFSDCIQKNKEPEPSGREGLMDVKIINAIYRSVELGRAVKIEPGPADPMPDLSQAIHAPAHAEPELVNVEAPNQSSE